MNGRHLKVVEEASFDVHTLSIPRLVAGQTNGLACIYVPEMAYQIIRDDFDNKHRVKDALNALVSVNRLSYVLLNYILLDRVATPFPWTLVLCHT